MNIYAGLKIAAALISRATLAVLLVVTFFRWCYLLAWWHGPTEGGYIDVTATYALAQFWIMFFFVAIGIMAGPEIWQTLKSWHKKEVGKIVERRKDRQLKRRTHKSDVSNIPSILVCPWCGNGLIYSATAGTMCPTCLTYYEREKWWSVACDETHEHQARCLVERTPPGREEDL